MIPHLVYIPYSPWSEKARFALDYCGVEYTRKPFTLMLDDWSVRLKLKRPFKNFTIPILFLPNGQAIEDSCTLAQSLPEVSRTLFKPEHLSEILEINQLCERLLDAGRVLASQTVLHNRDAMLENIPPFVPKALRPYLLSIVHFGIYTLDQQFGVLAKDAKTQRELMHADLLKLRTIIQNKRGPQGTLFESFSFGDIAAAGALHFIKPVQHPKIKISPHTRAAMTQTDFAQEFADLLQWRDQLYAQFRESKA